MRSAGIAFLAVAALSDLFAQPTRSDLKYNPVDLKDAVRHLEALHDDSTKMKIMAMTETEFVGGVHFTMGMWMRNEWGLWKGDTLAKYFNSIGVYHPDDMSGIILTSYYRQLKHEDWRVNEQVKSYQDYWQKLAEHDRKMQTDPAYREKVRLQQDSIRTEYQARKQEEWSTGKKVTGWIDYRRASISGKTRTEVEATIIGWEQNKLRLHIDKFLEEENRDRAIRLNKIVNNEIVVVNHELFELSELNFKDP